MLRQRDSSTPLRYAQNDIRGVGGKGEEGDRPRIYEDTVGLGGYYVDETAGDVD